MGPPAWLTFLEDRFISLYARIFGHAVIFDPDELYRGVHPNWVRNGEISSGAFDGDMMSVDLAKITTVERCWRRMKRTQAGLASITAGLARSQKQEVKHYPIPLNHAHTLVIGKKTRAVQRRLAKNARWVIKPG